VNHFHFYHLFYDLTLFLLSFHLYFCSSLRFLNSASHIEHSSFILNINSYWLNLENFFASHYMLYYCYGICFDFKFNVCLLSSHLYDNSFMNSSLIFRFLQIGFIKINFEICWCSNYFDFVIYYKIYFTLNLSAKIHFYFDF